MHHQSQSNAPMSRQNLVQDTDLALKLDAAHITFSSYDNNHYNIFPFAPTGSLTQLWNPNLYISGHAAEPPNPLGSRSPDLLLMEDRLSSSSTTMGNLEDPMADLTPTGLTWNLPPENPSETKDDRRRKSCLARGRFLQDGAVRKRVRFEDVQHPPNTECKICNLKYDLSQDDDSEFSLGPGDPFEVSKKCKRS